MLPSKTKLKQRRFLSTHHSTQSTSSPTNYQTTELHFSPKTCTSPHQCLLKHYFDIWHKWPLPPSQCPLWASSTQLPMIRRYLEISPGLALSACCVVFYRQSYIFTWFQSHRYHQLPIYLYKPGSFLSLRITDSIAWLSVRFRIMTLS